MSDMKDKITNPDVVDENSNEEATDVETTTAESSKDSVPVDETVVAETTAVESDADRTPVSEVTVSEEIEAESAKKDKKKPLIAAATVAVLLAGIYGGGAYYYSSHFPHAMKANGKSLGEMTVAEAEKVFTDDLASHSVTIKEKEREEVLDATSFGTVIDVGSQVQDYFDSLNPYTWFTNMFGEKDTTLTLNVSYDEAALNGVIDSMECFKEENVKAPKSCYIQAGEKEFEIVPEEPGNTVLKEEFIAAIEDCLSTCKTELNLEEANLYKLPKYFATDEAVTDALATANTYTKGTITHDFTYTTETLDYNTTKNWIEISKDFKVKLNASDVGDYVDALGKKYNTVGSARPFTTASGSKITIAEGDYGWQINFKKEKKQLIEDIKKGEDINRKPIYLYTAAKQTEKTDIGDSYVEVSISAQELWLFVDGDCVMNTSVVTGKPKFDTEKGVYGLTYKKRDDYLEGYNADGTPYRSHVDYWMPFNGNQGLHDASWRDDFGGSIYKSNGSHGCVNCPVWAAATLFKYVDENFPVIIY